MIRILLDTDVVLDMLANRQPFVVEASVLWLAHEQGRLEACISPITPVNVSAYTATVSLVFVRDAINETNASYRGLRRGESDIRP